MPNEDEVNRALAEIVSLGEVQDRAMPDPKKLCETWNKLKPALKQVTPVLVLIPAYGAAISAALGVLGQIADQLCPQSET
jgi:hypothetical protein